MAHYVQAISLYGPRLLVGEPASMEDVAARIAPRAGVGKATAATVLRELDSALLFFLLAGRPVQLLGVGRFATTIKVSGLIRVTFRQDAELVRSINATGAYHGAIRNRDNIGLGPSDYKIIWDADHPDDPLDLSSPC
jgi:hypothetical protein